MTSDFLLLKDQVARARLADRQPRYYFLLILGISVGLAGCLVAFTRELCLPWILINTLIFAYLNVQLGFMMHDAGHSALSGDSWKNDVVGLCAGNLLSGISYGWWAPHHARHHAHPNHLKFDPDLVMLKNVFALSYEDAREARGWRTLVYRYQAYVMPFLFPFETFGLKFYGFRFLLLERSRYRGLEVLLLAVHYTFYFWFLIHYLGFRVAVGVSLLQHVVAGIYLSIVLMPNHVARPLIPEDLSDFLANQTEPTRNVKTHFVINGLWGGLNHQIEHHLFPAMSRNKLRKALPVVRSFCESRGVTYHEDSFFECYRDIFLYLNEIGATVRMPWSKRPPEAAIKLPQGPL